MSSGNEGHEQGSPHGPPARRHLRLALAGTMAVCVAGLAGMAFAMTPPQQAPETATPLIPSSAQAVPVPAPGPTTNQRAGAAVLRLTPAALRKIARTPELRRAPWLFQENGSPFIQRRNRRAGLAFPLGVSYQEALESLYRSVTLNGTLPTGSRLVRPLPNGKVIQVRSGSSGIVLDLRSPWGYHPVTGQITTPTFAMPIDLTPAEVESRIQQAAANGDALPAEAFVVPPEIPDCQVLVPAAPSPSCLEMSR